METKLAYMKRMLKELEDGYKKLATIAEDVLTSLSLGTDDGDPGPMEVITALRKQVRIGEEYMKPYVPKYKAGSTDFGAGVQDISGWCEEHSTNYSGERCNFGEHRRKL